MAKKVKDTLIVSDADLNAMIDKIVASAAGIVHDIQRTVVSIAIKAARDGNNGFMQRLDDGLGQGFHRNTLRRWAVKHGPFTYATKATDKVKAGYTYSKDKGDKLLAKLEADEAGTIAEMMAERWEEQEKEPEFNGFSLLKTLKRALSQAEKVKGDSTKANHPENSFKGIGELKRLIAQLEGKVPTNDNPTPTPTVTPTEGETQLAA